MQMVKTLIEGATHFILSFLGEDFEKEATLFMDEVVPSV